MEPKYILFFVWQAHSVLCSYILFIFIATWFCTVWMYHNFLSLQCVVDSHVGSPKLCCYEHPRASYWCTYTTYTGSVLRSGIVGWESLLYIYIYSIQPVSPSICIFQSTLLWCMRVRDALELLIIPIIIFFYLNNSDCFW